MRPNQKIETEQPVGLENQFNDNLQDILGLKLTALQESASVPLPDLKIEFADAHIPTLKRGEYKIEVHQDFLVPNEKTETTGKGVKQFIVNGPRYKLPKTAIKAVFPPKNGSGNFDHVLPHMSFNRASIPWELEMENHVPWLALIVFREEEVPKIESKSIEDLSLNNLTSFEDLTETVDVIEVSQDFIPSAAKWQVHTRKIIDLENEQNEVAFIFANRTVQSNTKHTIHLISLHDPLSNNQFISLHHWEFNCQNNRPDFKGTLEKLSVKPYRFYAEKKDNKYYLEGYVPLPHFLRLGFQTLSLYQTPLLPYELKERKPLKSDKVETKPSKPKYEYERVEWKELTNKSKIADVSFAAAFHLGQMLTVADKNVAQSIFKWKRRLYQEEKRRFLEDKTKKSSAHILKEKPSNSLPKIVADWVHDLLTLKRIPFNYLVPYEAMLPQQSIRFFKLNKKWLKNCLDGMFSIGEEFFSFKSEHVLYSDEYTGFILRTQLVGDYPEMKIKGYTYRGQELAPFFSHKLSNEVLLCCFKGELSSVDIYLPTNAIHFGVDVQDKKTTLKRRNKQGKIQDKIEIDQTIAENGCIDLAALATKLAASSPAELAMQLVDNSPKVSFKPPNNNNNKRGAASPNT